MTGVILQARMGSTRLPGKVLKPIGDMLLLEHIFYRLKSLKHSVTIVLATSVLPIDDILENFCKERGIACFRGSEENVLERYYLCAKQYGFDRIVRLTGDNPFTDIDELDRLIDLHVATRSDYTHSFGVLPIGVGAEIFTFDALEKSYLHGTKDNHLEHVNEYIQENPRLFSIAVLDVSPEKHHPDVRLTVDTDEDYKRACYIAEHAATQPVTTVEAIELCTHFA